MQLNEITETLDYTIILTGKMILKDFNASFFLANAEITFEQMGVLYCLSNNEDKEMIQQDIALLIGRTKSAVLRIIDILEEKQLLRRVPSSNDRRKNIIQITPKGSALMKEILERFHYLREGLTANIPKDEVTKCFEVLKKIQSNCKNIKKRTQFNICTISD